MPPGSLDAAAGRLRLKTNFTECRLILRNVLLEHVEKRLGLLRAHVNSLEVLYGYVIGGCLSNAAEQKQEVPQIHTDLDAVGVVLAVVGCIGELDLGTHGLRHMPSVAFDLACQCATAFRINFGGGVQEGDRCFWLPFKNLYEFWYNHCSSFFVG
jgi:hypothetical protein